LASMEFPVEGYGKNAIQSFFGDPRDGGKREHHGVDIFAPRHTAVIAPIDGTVSSVGENRLGGHVVWMYNAKLRMHIYFAHLETQDVEERKTIKAGTKIGTVGNSGNARTTSPHLHFGIYPTGGVADPYYFLVNTDTTTTKPVNSTKLLGNWVQPTIQIEEENSPVPVKLLATVGDKYRVMFMNGRKDMISAQAFSVILKSQFADLRKDIPGSFQDSSISE